MTTAEYFITTPYIDAYQRSWPATDVPRIGYSSPGVPEATFEEFETMMERQAWQWGEQGLGRALLNGIDPPIADDPDDEVEYRYVLAFGNWGEDWYVAVEQKGDFGNHEIKLIKQADDWSIPDGWDVT